MKIGWFAGSLTHVVFRGARQKAGGYVRTGISGPTPLSNVTCRIEESRKLSVLAERDEVIFRAETKSSPQLL